ncbi:chemerin-like receptor 1 [Brachyhypopomus gauderio]|uniref:chemerin-like receptor 1 n=1 Tax=Brachyhypopomus gauderio TaxID=698409 RepID=UPI00404322CD
MNFTAIPHHDTNYGHDLFDDGYVYDGYNDNTAISPDIDQTMSSPPCRDATCVSLAIANVIIFMLGVTGNGLVIWIAGFKMKKLVNTTWYLSLAMSDFLYCVFLPFYVVYLVKGDWVFGVFMCKFMSFILFLNMFSSIILLVFISVDRCVVVMLPVWAQNQRTVRKASVMVILAWITSAVLSTPSAIFQDVSEDHMTLIKKCFNNFIVGGHDHIATVVRRFIFGFVIPFLIIVTCYVLIIQKLKTNQMAKSTKPFKIMTVLIVTFVICWLPFHIVALIELNHTKDHSQKITTAQAIVDMLASANSFLNPFLYAFMGKDITRKFYAILSKIESAIEEEGRSTVRGTSITSSGEGKLSTAF